jgi:hypothetical protein
MTLRMNTDYINRNDANLIGDFAEGGCTVTSLRTRSVAEGGGAWRRVVRPSRAAEFKRLQNGQQNEWVEYKKALFCAQNFEIIEIKYKKNQQIITIFVHNFCLERPLYLLVSDATRCGYATASERAFCNYCNEPPTHLSKRGPYEQNFVSTPFPVQRKLLKSASKIQHSCCGRTEGLALDRSVHTVSC